MIGKYFYILYSNRLYLIIYFKLSIKYEICNILLEHLMKDTKVTNNK